MSYILNTLSERGEMLAVLGLESIDALFADVPAEQRYPDLDLPPALAEMELIRLLRALAEKNVDLDHKPSFLGAGAYRHFIPAVVDHILRRGEFCTAYTPYQAEVSQGTLTAIYEYQTMVARLVGMEVANASMYDGATALAEAALMAARITHRQSILISATVHPEHRQVLTTYTQGMGLSIRDIPYDTKQGTTELVAQEGMLDDEVACVIVQHPNFFGCLEDLAELGKAAHEVEALFVVSVDPIAMGLFKPPGEYGADIVIGEGQALGNPLSFGGPYLGLFACREKHLRQMPGRLVGMTKDRQGKRGFVLTLQTREQHIRREKATSNICSNEALAALAATVYLAVMGKEGLRQVAELCYHKAHYAAQNIVFLAGYELLFTAPFFMEFVIRMPLPAVEANARLLERDIVGGYDLGRVDPKLGDAMLFCVTEMTSGEDIDKLVDALKEMRP